MTNVFSIEGKELPTTFGEPCEKVVEALEKALSQAKSGRLRAVGICMVDGNYWSANDFAIDGPFYASLIGASVILTKDIVGDA